MTYKNRGIFDANVYVPSIYHDCLRFQLWRAKCENFSQNHISMKLSFFKSNFLPTKIFMILLQPDSLDSKNVCPHFFCCHTVLEIIFFISKVRK